MLKIRYYILSLLILIGCSPSKSKETSNFVSDSLSVQILDKNILTNNTNAQYFSTKETQNEDLRKQSLKVYNKATYYHLSDTIIADFNGDGVLDKAIYKKEEGTSGIIFKHGKNNEEVRIGFGKPFTIMRKLDWVDYWGLVEDRETFETTFKEDGDVLGGKLVKLQNLSIALGRDEVGVGLITFKNGKYVWIHQTC